MLNETVLLQNDTNPFCQGFPILSVYNTAEFNYGISHTLRLLSCHNMYLVLTWRTIYFLAGCKLLAKWVPARCLLRNQTENTVPYCHFRIFIIIFAIRLINRMNSKQRVALVCLFDIWIYENVPRYFKIICEVVNTLGLNWIKGNHVRDIKCGVNQSKVCTYWPSRYDISLPGTKRE